MFLCDNRWKFWKFSILQLWSKFSEKCKPFPIGWSTVFWLKVLRLKTQRFYSKLLCQEPIEWGVENGPITKNRVLLATTLFFQFFVSVWEHRIKSWFDVPTTQTSIFKLFESIGISFEIDFSLWVSLKSVYRKGKTLLTSSLLKTVGHSVIIVHLALVHLRLCFKDQGWSGDKSTHATMSKAYYAIITVVTIVKTYSIFFFLNQVAFECFQDHV